MTEKGIKINQMVYDLGDIAEILVGIQDKVDEIEEEKEKDKDALKVGRKYCKYLQELLKENGVEYERGSF